MMPYADPYRRDYLAEQEAELFGAMSWAERLDSLEELCELTGMDLQELLTPPALLRKRPTKER